MTLVLETTIYRWNCDSFSELPSTAPEGSTAHIVTTGEVYIFHDGGWVQDLRAIAAAQAV
jgi:hypothetical protein